MAAIKDLIGEKVLKTGGEVSVSDFTGSQAKKAVVGLYFSAHWCPPCRGFTPKLAEFYTNFNNAKYQLEIVFISSDQDESQFEDYFGEMPWYALPYSDKVKKDALSKKYGISGIPTLILLDGETGDILCKDARMQVQNDESGAKFPWNQ